MPRLESILEPTEPDRSPGVTRRRPPRMRPASLPPPLLLMAGATSINGGAPRFCAGISSDLPRLPSPLFVLKHF